MEEEDNEEKLSLVVLAYFVCQKPSTFLRRRRYLSLMMRDFGPHSDNQIHNYHGKKDKQHISGVGGGGWGNQTIEAKR